MSNHLKKQCPTPEARQAAVEARRRIAAAKGPMGSPQMFLVRLAGLQPFGWEIRKLGSFVSRSETGFKTLLLAQTAGEQALAVLVAP